MGDPVRTLDLPSGGLSDSFLRHLADVLDSHYRKLHDALSGSWADVDERRFVDSAAQLQIQPQSDNPVRIESILAVAGVAAGQAMMIELGGGDGHKFVIPPNPAAGPGFAVFATSGLSIRLTHTDPRFISVVTLTGSTMPGARGSGTAGFLYLALGGHEIPRGAIQW